MKPKNIGEDGKCVRCGRAEQLCVCEHPDPTLELFGVETLVVALEKVKVEHCPLCGIKSGRIPEMEPVGVDDCGEYYYECKTQEEARFWIKKHDVSQQYIEIGHAVGPSRPGQKILIEDLIFRVYLFDTYLKYLGRKSGDKIEDGDICRIVEHGRVVMITHRDLIRRKEVGVRERTSIRDFREILNSCDFDLRLHQKEKGDSWMEISPFVLLHAMEKQLEWMVAIENRGRLKDAVVYGVKAINYLLMTVARMHDLAYGEHDPDAVEPVVLAPRAHGRSEHTLASMKGRDAIKKEEYTKIDDKSDSAGDE